MGQRAVLTLPYDPVVADQPGEARGSRRHFRGSKEDLLSHPISRRSVLRGAAVAATAAAAAPLISLRDRPAFATPEGTPWKITYRKTDNALYIADADGSNAVLLASNGGAATGVGNTGSGSWAPDGSRFVYTTATYGVASVRADGTAQGSSPAQLTVIAPTSNGYTGASQVAFSRHGSLVFYTVNGELRYTAADGNWDGGYYPLFDASVSGTFYNPTVAPDNTVYFEGQLTGETVTSIYRRDSATGATKIVDGATQPDISPDGSKIVFVRPSADGSQRHLWTANIDGSNAAQLTADETQAYNVDPRWSPDGQYILYTHNDQGLFNFVVRRIDVVNGGAPVDLVTGAWGPTWQPVRGNYVDRVWGNSALDTSVATSRYNWADHGVNDGLRGQATCVVLSRDDYFYDALSGSALAVAKGGPLMITPRSGLDSQVEAEIKRVLGDPAATTVTGTVYLLGGTDAMPLVIENRLRSLGYAIKRLGGVNMFDTTVLVAREITQTPTTVIVSTGYNYYDALSAGAAAGATPGTVIMLTGGDYMPPQTAAYLNTLDPHVVDIVAAGGPGDRALVSGYNNGMMPNWPADSMYYSLVGEYAEDTAVAVAEFFFTGPVNAAVATTLSWYDALTGGAMIGSNWGPLLLTSSTSLYHGVQDYLNRNSSSITNMVMLGGPNALNPALQTPIGNAISSYPDSWKYTDYTNTWQPATTRSNTGTSTLAPRTASPQRSTLDIPPRKTRHANLRRTVKR